MVKKIIQNFFTRKKKDKNVSIKRNYSTDTISLRRDRYFQFQLEFFARNRIREIKEEKRLAEQAALEQERENKFLIRSILS